MLSTDEIKRRIHAARILRDVTQRQLEQMLAETGLGKRELGRIERGDLPLTKVRRVALAGALRVPEAWFLEEDIDVLVGYTDADKIAEMATKASDLVTAEEATDELRRATRVMEQLLRQLGRDVGMRDREWHRGKDHLGPTPEANN